MANENNKYIQLNRTFHELNLEGNSSDDIDFNNFIGKINNFSWSEVIKLRRVILLSEAGAGKTLEIRNAAQKLRLEGKPAFFVRIEHVRQSFEDSFEEGTFEEFNKWCESGDEGWLFLDSADEARLREPSDFELALRVLGRKLSKVLPNAHIVITGRTTAWRAKTDLLLCEKLFPYSPPQLVENKESEETENQVVAIERKKDAPSATSFFKIITLEDLHGAQIDAFLHGKEVVDPAEFRNEVERKDAWELTTRPQDLDELIEFWKSEGQIGSRLELMQSSINRRLKERDQSRAEAHPISQEKLRRGVRLLAAATTLTQMSAIRVPDGSENSKGIPVKEVLTDWNDTDCSALLNRPIFDEGIYGTVRFHHRSVREYLTAEWLHSLIVDEGSRLKIEGLFFREKYGIAVIVPTMRPILPWLAILDERILNKVTKVAPEIIFEGGDPSQLPLNIRVHFLRLACEQLKKSAYARSFNDFGAVQRFANPDLADEIIKLLSEYEEYDEVMEYLLRMIWRAQMVTTVTQVIQLALTSKNKYTRIAAFNAMGAIGSPEDQREVRQSLLKEASIKREWLAELLEELPADEESVSWLLEALESTPAKRKFEVDNLMRALSNYASNTPKHLLPRLITGLHVLIQKPPFIERTHCEVSAHFSWLLQTAAESLLVLIKEKNRSVFQPALLSLLNLIPSAGIYDEYEFKELGKELDNYIKLWTEISYKLFWHEVPHARLLLEKDKQKLTHYWQVGMFGGYWKFTIDDFKLLCEDIKNRELLDDKILALQIAYVLYRENERPRQKLLLLKKLAMSDPALSSTLNLLIHPPPSGLKAHKRMEASWRRKSKLQAEKRERDKRLSIDYLKIHLNEFNGSINPEIANNSQYYLHNHMREKDNNSGSWSEGKWQLLIEEFGEDIASSFRNGALKFWRYNRPILQSEGAEKTSTPFHVIFGLTGLAIEAREIPNWLDNVTSKDAEIAARYALNELNGFPAWLPELYDKYPQVVIDIVMQEINFELKNNSDQLGSQYVLSDVSWSGNWMWNRVAPLLLKKLEKPVKSLENLRYILKIIEGSSINNDVIAEIAKKKCTIKRVSFTTPMWFALWVGTEPEVATPALEKCLASIKSEQAQTQFAMQFLAALIGGRREGHFARLAFRTVEHMKTLYLLMQKYVKESDDIDRVGGGVYSPGLRDAAQDARNTLLSFIRETPGKDAYLAINEIAQLHLSENSRAWLELQAKNKATLDAFLLPWTPQQVKDFNHEVESTPSNHEDLWYLAIDRLNNLKYDLEDGDSSIASILLNKEETEVRKYIGNWCRDHSGSRYNITQEEELADAKRPDFRFLGMGFDAPVPAELKLAEKWSGPSLFERLEIQLSGDYLRDIRSSRGIFVLMYGGGRSSWTHPNGKSIDSITELIAALQEHWAVLSPGFPSVEEIKIIGIDLTKRGIDTKESRKHKS